MCLQSRLLASILVLPQKIVYRSLPIKPQRGALERAYYLWNLFATCLRDLDDLSDRVGILVQRRTEKKSSGTEASGPEKIPQENTAEQNTTLDASPRFHTAMNAALDSIAEIMDLLYHIGRQAESFWQLVTNMSEILACCQARVPLLLCRILSQA